MTIEIDDTKLRAALQSLSAGLNDPSTALDKIGEILASNIRINLGQGLQYDGSPMVPLKNPSERRTGKRPRVSPVPLNDTRQHIYNRINHRLIDQYSVEIGLNDGSEHIGAVHQFGSPRRNIPARPFLPINDLGNVDLPSEWQDDVTEIVANALKAALR